ncbi:glycerate kinase [Vibrio parahaemolyticus]|uniref:glycerate kinase n=1 Tax=Vibrio mediterranei TaxID=689 RepID=UPI0040679656
MLLELGGSANDAGADIANSAQRKVIPTIAIAGSLGHEIVELYSTINSIFGTVRSPPALEQVLIEASKNLTRSASNIAATFQLGAKILD